MNTVEWNEFLSKLEWEGGVVGIYEWGGVNAFPVEAQSAARDLGIALQTLNEMIEAHDEEAI